MTIEIRIHAEVRSIPEALWDGLDGAREAPFLRWAWFDALERTKCVGVETGWQPHHLSFWEADELVAAAPAYLKDNSEGEFVFDHGWANASERAGIRYYPKLVVAVPFTPAAGPRLLVKRPADRPRLLAVLADGLRRIVAAEGLSGAHVLFPTEAEARALAGAGMAHRLGIQFQWQNRGYGSFEDYLGRFSSKRRNQIRRERKEIQKSGLVIETLRGEIPAPMIDAAYGFYTSTVDKFSWGRRYLNRDFFDEVFARLRGEVEVVVATEQGEPIAGAVNLAGASALYGRYWGAKVDRPFLHFNVCLYHSIDDCIARGVGRFEPGAGGSHKLVRGFEPALTHSAHHLAHPGLDRAVREFLTREREAHEASAAQADVAFR